MRVLYFLAACASAMPAMAGDRFDHIRDFIRSQMVEKSLPSVAVALVKDRKIIWEEGFGWADKEKRIAADVHTMYSLASISKSFTATGLMVLVQRGAIDLDKPVNDYLGAAKLRARIGDPNKATVRVVANHRSGLPLHYQFFYEDEPWHRPSMDDTILRYGFLATPPGERQNYSNLGYGVLDYLIERVSHVSYADFMRREVFAPLGLTRASVDIGPGLAPYAAQRYDTNGAPIPFYTFDHVGASAIYCSAHDLARFAMFQMKAHLPDEKAILTDKAIDTLHQGSGFTEKIGDIEADYGLGINVFKKDGYRGLSHAGGMGGVSTVLLMIPDEQLAVVVLVNAQNGPVSEIANKIVAMFLPRWKTTKPAPTPPAPFVPTAEWVGTWKGTLSTYEKEIPVELNIRASGEIIARFADQIPSLVDKAALTDGELSGQLRATIGTPDTERFPYVVVLSLRQQGGALSGSATALQESEPRVRNALSHWIELRKVP